jgi:formate hydrogenlyase subunit 3/multisubunit Na+/H+ antiporter MnhD subunit
MIFSSFELPLLAALALTAGLYHALNHALFKGLLFMGAGAVLQATGERDMDGLGGLIHRMPWTAVLMLLGCCSIAALPPLNGFVSEWLTFQAFLLSPSLPVPLMKLLVPMGAALFALTAALAAACFVKAYGLTFLGHWRGRAPAAAAEVGWAMRGGMILAAAGCVALGVLPSLVIGWMDSVPQQLVGAAVSPSRWMWTTPVAQERASYSAPVLLAGVAVVIAAAYFLLHVRPGAIRRAPIWDCGFERLTVRMQYSAGAFAMPLRRIFGFLFHVRERVTPFAYPGQAAYPRRLRYRLSVRDRFWGWLYQPVVDACLALARQAGRLQQGRIQAYLISSFLTVIVLLVFLR